MTVVGAMLRLAARRNVGKLPADLWRCIVHVDVTRDASREFHMRAAPIARCRTRNAAHTARAFLAATVAPLM